MHLSAQHSRLAAWIAVPLAVVLSGTVIGTASYAAFSDSTENAGNTWASGKVELTDDDAGVALFDATGIAPGQSETKCLTVTSASTVDSTVTMYVKDSSTASPLSDQLQMTVSTAAAGTDCAATSFTPDFSGSLSQLMQKTDHGAGIGGWDTGTTTSSHVVKIGWELPTTADNTAQDATAATTFVWEAVSK
ncbi:hypothetical protein [Curtobacterium sp. MCBD17_032]|uniref:hypothetical protein n=1 Tax=Curtobacterium sp. MCBD17_032 TaxID=2175659 RepID=UPI000DAAA5EE|nr:hypothetical protein [Curtobacterium sp. MCBD17_032]PZE81080.1 hypothetical protein DEI91_13225 [Curtobacterium sp. MCBD17_032]